MGHVFLELSRSQCDDQREAQLPVRGPWFDRNAIQHLRVDLVRWVRIAMVT